MQDQTTEPLTGILRIDHVNIDFDTLQIDGPDGISTIEPKVMEVFSVLIQNAGEVVTRESLIDEVWGVGFGGDERLSRAISLLRKALGDKRGKYKFIKTIPRRGYMLDADIKLTESQDSKVIREMRANGPAVRAPKYKALVGLLITLPILIASLIGMLGFGEGGLFNRGDDRPLVVIMDSAHPSRIYDESVIADGATNADILSDIFADLPIRTQKELISPSWHRHESIAQFEPDLIVIHYSGFKQADASGDRPQLRALVEYFENTETEFLIYSRASEAWLDGNMNIILADIYEKNPGLKARVDIFPLLEYGEPKWKDQNTALAIKLKIKESLNLE